MIIISIEAQIHSKICVCNPKSSIKEFATEFSQTVVTTRTMMAIIDATAATIMAMLCLGIVMTLLPGIVTVGR